MSKLTKEYISEVIKMLEKIANEEEQAIHDAAKLMADAIQNGQRIFAFGCTHSSITVQDIIYRAGGLILVNPIYAPGLSSLDVFPNTLTSAIERLEGYAKVILDNQPIQKDDILILVSVSGRNAVPVEMAKNAQERGIKVIGITSRKYTEGVESRHPSGRKMYQFADIVIDNKVEKGDAVLSAEGVPARFTPASGITTIAVLQSLTTATIEELLARGFTPPILIAANVDGGEKHNKELFEKYHDRIFYL